MKTRLLKRLRREVILLERNGKYKVYQDDTVCPYETGWMTKQKAISVRREMILFLAKKYRRPKQAIKD